MRRLLAMISAVATLVASGCGGDLDSEPLGPTRDSGPEADVAAVRAMVGEYVRASVAHDWSQVCELLTPEMAAEQVVGDRATCAGGLGYKAWDFVPPGGSAGAHPERANEDLLSADVTAVVVTGDVAQVALKLEGLRDPHLLSVHREDGSWKLASSPSITIPLDNGTPSARPLP